MRLGYNGSKRGSGTAMFNTIVHKADLLNIGFSIIAVIALIVNEGNFLLSAILLAATGALLFSKRIPSRVSIFITYTATTMFLAILFLTHGGKHFMENVSILGSTAIIFLLSLLIGGLAALSRFSTNSVSVLWFTLHTLILIASFQTMGDDSFLTALWGAGAQKQVINSLYPILIAAVLIAVFLDKYRFEIKRERKLR